METPFLDGCILPAEGPEGKMNSTDASGGIGRENVWHRQKDRWRNKVKKWHVAPTRAMANTGHISNMERQFLTFPGSRRLR